MIDFSEISDDGEEWELFARDFLAQEGYKILSEPDRGPDGRKDLLVSETYKGIRGGSVLSSGVNCILCFQLQQLVNELKTLS
jgi:hypothetical protein